MKYSIYSTGQCVIADLEFMQQHHAGDFVEVPEAPATPVRELTHLGFRRRFTDEEKELADELEVTFETNPGISTGQKRTLRSGYKDFYAGTSVNLDDPDIPPMLALYEALGIIAAGRAAEILA